MARSNIDIDIVKDMLILEIEGRDVTYHIQLLTCYDGLWSITVVKEDFMFMAAGSSFHDMIDDLLEAEGLPLYG